MAVAQGVHTACGFERIAISEPKAKVLASKAKLAHSGLNEVSERGLNGQTEKPSIAEGWPSLRLPIYSATSPLPGTTLPREAGW